MRAFPVAVVLLVLTSAPALAAPEDLANEVASEVMSPYCDGVTLHDCPSRAALDLRSQIEDWARQGWTKAEIMGELERQFGPRIHASPRETPGLAAWVLPGIALLAGLVVAGTFAARWTRRRAAETSEGVEPRDHARIERELAALREEMR